MKDVDIADLIKIIENQNRLLKYYTLSWFLVGVFSDCAFIIIISLLFSKGV